MKNGQELHPRTILQRKERSPILLVGVLPNGKTVDAISSVACPLGILGTGYGNKQETKECTMER